MIHKVKGFCVVNEAKLDVFLKFICFLYDPTNAGNLSSGYSAFFKSSLYVWKFLVHVLLKPSLKDFEHNLTRLWNECNCAVVWTFLGIVFWRDWNENWPFLVLWPLVSFPDCWHFECSSLLSSSSFRIWNSWTGIPSPLLALFVVMLLKAYLTSHSRMSLALGEWNTIMVIQVINIFSV